MTQRREPIVSVGLQGGLGNQMFQYAAGHAVARRTGATLQLDLGHYARFDKRRYELACFGVPARISSERSPTAPRGPAHWVALRIVNRLGLPAHVVHGGWNVYTQVGFHFDPAFEALRAPIHLDGYFQSELYFREVAGEIRDLFTIRVPTSPAYDDARAKIAVSEWPVAIHVRRGDFISDPTLREVNNILDASYYRAAMSLGERLSPRPATYFVVSDDIGLARRLFGGAGKVVYLSDQAERPWEDLALMAACRAQIIANSTFSWWGAWLNPHPDKWVIAPRQWFAKPLLRRSSTADLFCPGWITM